jgi:hypothetical protein
MIAAAALVLVLAMTAPALAGDAAPSSPAYSRSELKALAARIAVEEGISPSLFDALITAESNYRVDVVSPKGAMSLAQLMPATAAELGIAEADHFDPEINLRGGARYLKAQLDAVGDVAIALGAYNAGMKRVKDRPFEHWPRETRAYVTAILKRLEPSVVPMRARRVVGSIVSMPKPVLIVDAETHAEMVGGESPAAVSPSAPTLTPTTLETPESGPSGLIGGDPPGVSLDGMIDLATGATS